MHRQVPLSLSLFDAAVLPPRNPLETPSKPPRNPVPSPFTLNFEVVIEEYGFFKRGMTIYKVVCVVVCVVRTDGCVRVCVCVDGRQS